MIKKLIIVLPFVLLVLSCSKKQGCRDANALNYDASAESDGTCQYTRIIFYAGRNVVGGNGTPIEKIEVYELIVEDSELIGTITNLQPENPAPDGCTPSTHSIEYMFGSSQEKDVRFTTRYYYVDGISEAGNTYILSPSKDTECIVENLTL